MERTITELSVDYFKAAENMDELIKKTTAGIKEAAENHETDKICQLKQKRLIFYSQKRELLNTAHKLKNYYNKEEDLLESA